MFWLFKFTIEIFSSPAYFFLIQIVHFKLQSARYIESARAWPYFETNEKTLFLTDFLFLEPFQVLLSMVGHDKHRLGVVLDWLLRVKRTPWNELVKDYQDELEKSVGMMTRVKRYVPLDQ